MRNAAYSPQNCGEEEVCVLLKERAALGPLTLQDILEITAAAEVLGSAAFMHALFTDVIEECCRQPTSAQRDALNTALKHLHDIDPNSAHEIARYKRRRLPAKRKAVMTGQRPRWTPRHPPPERIPACA